MYGSKDMDLRHAITQDEIEQIRNRYKIGDRVMVDTYKSFSEDSLARTVLRRPGRIVAKYPCYAVVELSSGVQDSVLWIDLILQKKNKPGLIPRQ